VRVRVRVRVRVSVRVWVRISFTLVLFFVPFVLPILVEPYVLQPSPLCVWGGVGGGGEGRGIQLKTRVSEKDTTKSEKWAAR
jgi:hypothetical protein